MDLNVREQKNSSTLQDEYVAYILLLFLSVIKQFQNTGVWPQSSGSVILISCLFSSSSFVIGSLEINLSWSVWGYVIVGSYLVERGNGSWGVAAEAVAPLDCGDDALEVSAVQQLGKLQEAMAQDKQLWKTDKQLKMLRAFLVRNRNIGMWRIHTVGTTEMSNLKRSLETNFHIYFTAASCCQTYNGLVHSACLNLRLWQKLDIVMYPEVK